MDAVEAELATRLGRIEKAQNNAALRGVEIRSMVERLADAVDRQNGSVTTLKEQMEEVHIWQARLEAADSAVSFMRRRDAAIAAIVISAISVAGPWIRDAVLAGAG